jgi:hypothetical protein
MNQFFFICNLFKFIHDFNTGVGYVINKHIGNCTIYSLGTQSIDSDDSTFNPFSNYAQIEMKSPEMYFNIDDTYYYSGQRYERGIICDVWVSRRTDFKLDDSKVDSYIFELFVYNQDIIISIHVSAPGVIIFVSN